MSFGSVWDAAGFGLAIILGVAVLALSGRR
jgi:hypothetical protein